MKILLRRLAALSAIVAPCCVAAPTAQLIVTAPPALAGSYAAVTYDQAPSNVTSTTPEAQGDFFIYDGVDCQAHTLSKPVAGSGSGKVALLTGAFPATCTYYDDVVRELQQDGVVAVVFGLANGSWRNALLHGNAAGLSVPVLYMQVDEVSNAIRTAVVGGASVSASFVAVAGMDMKEVVDWYVAGQTRPYGLVPWHSNPSTGATWDMSTFDWDRTTSGVQQNFAYPPSTCGGTSFNYDPIAPRVSSTVPAGSTYTGRCNKTFLVRDTSGYQGIGLISLYIGVPYARSDAAQTTAGTAVAIDVLANDSGESVTKDVTRLDLNPSTTAVDQAVSAVEGNWSVTGGKVVFAPAEGFIGPASIQYVVRGANGGSSNTVGITVTVLPVATPILAGAVSRKVHNAAGSFDLPLSLVSNSPTVEPRTGPAQAIVFTFDKPVTAGAAAVTEGTATAGVPTFSGNELRVPLTGVANQQYVTVAVSDVVAADGGTGGAASVRVGFLLGDVNQNRAVSLSDLGQVNAQIAQIVTSANYLKDVNVSGTLSLTDKGITNTQITKVLPTP